MEYTIAPYARISILYLLASIAISQALTWVFHHTQGSVLLTLLAHAAIIAIGVSSAMVSLFPASILQDDTYPAIMIGLGAAVVALRVMTRGRLGLPSKPEYANPNIDVTTQRFPRHLWRTSCGKM